MNKSLRKFIDYLEVEKDIQNIQLTIMREIFCFL